MESLQNKAMLGQILIDIHRISDKDLAEAVRVQKDRGGLIGIILLELGFVTEHDLVYALELQQKLRQEK